MSYIVKHLQPKSVLVQEFYEYPNNIHYYAKYDTFIGSAESIQYIEQLLKQKYG